MLKVKVSLKDDSIISLEAEGHTGLSARGNDVACAGASAVILGAVLGCTRHLNITPGIEQDDGYLYLCMPDNLSESDNRCAQAILATAILTLEEIGIQHPGHISIVKENL